MRILMLDNVSISLTKGLNGFRTISPGIGLLFKHKLIKYLLQGYGLVKEILPIIKREKKLEVVISNHIGSKLLSILLKPVSSTVYKSHMRAQYVKRHSSKGRTWINPLIDSNSNGRIIKKIIIIYHNANKAKAHIDIHIGLLSFIIKVTGKPVEEKIKFNTKGELTQAAKDAIIDHIRQEIFNHSRVPQNLDHSISNAKCTWNVEEKGLIGYGSGLTRQIVAEDKVEFYHTHITSSLHMYAPLITPHQGLYLYKIYNGDKTNVPVVIWGALIPRDQRFEDRLHLKMETDFEKFRRKTRIDTTTRKYDGASTYFSTTGQGFKFFSPRFSKITGHRIEYTYKLPELAEYGFGPVKPDRNGHTTGMAEILFYKQNLFGKIFSTIFSRKGPEGICWNYLSAAEIGGILNSYKIRPVDIYPEIRIYRVDLFLEERVIDLPFFENRKLQEKIAKNNKYFKLVRLVKPFIYRNNYEGYIAVPDNKSITEGYKYKFLEDEIDMTISSIDFYISEKKNIAGTVSCIYNNKIYKFGPSAVGTDEKCLDYIMNKKNLVGNVVKTVGFKGHVGRGTKILCIHMDK